MKSLTLLILTLGGAVTLCCALVTTSEHGTWPESWPRELEDFRQHGKTFGYSSQTEECAHEVVFPSREAFEKAWPHLLKLKSKGAPLIVESLQSTNLFPKPEQAAVRVLAPSPPGRGFTDAERNRPFPWPDTIKLPDGTWPEFVVHSEGGWVPAEKAAIRYRVRQDLVLIVDGNIIDLNRIPLPADTPIIDRRFQGSASGSDGKP